MRSTVRNQIFHFLNKIFIMQQNFKNTTLWEQGGGKQIRVKENKLYTTRILVAYFAVSRIHDLHHASFHAIIKL